jgi:prevent-host-death family protein
MTTLTITEARKQLYRLVEEVQSSGEPVHLTGRHGDAVLLSAADWRSVEETLYLLSIPGMRESILEGMETPTENMAAELDW